MDTPDGDTPHGPHGNAGERPPRQPEEPHRSTRNAMSGASRDSVQAGSVSGGVHFHQRGDDHAGPRVRPRQLPADVRGFVNRSGELGLLSAVLPGQDGAPLAVSVWVIAGTAGAGKTSLALRWAHQVQERFPHGQLYVNLRGYDPGEPVTAQRALHGFLTALGVRPHAIPQDLDSAAALYRSLLADRRVLVVLDNAATAAQVRPLLPGGSGTLAIVTSRSRLSGLAIRDGARRLTLSILPESEAVALLRAITADHRPEDDAQKLVELARLCARLPIALRIAAEYAASSPHLPLDDVIAGLRDQSALWDVLSTGDEDDAEAESVRAVFAWSYRALSESAARLFRLLGLHPGPEIGLPAAATLAKLPASRTRQLLNVLVSAHLLDQTAPDRYEFHDLLRAYAAEQVRQDESPGERTAVLSRLLDWYVHTTHAAQGWIEPTTDHLPLDPPADGVTPLAFTDYDQAVDWSEREYPNLLAALRAAPAAGLHRHAWQLSAVLFNALPPTAAFGDWLVITLAGLAAVRRVGDRAEEARMLQCVGMSYSQLDQHDRARTHHQRALAIHRELGDRHGQARCLNLIGLTHLHLRALPEAETHFLRARGMFTELDLGYRADIARMNLVLAWYQAGRLDEAAGAAQQVLRFQREHGSADDVGDILALLSLIHGERGEPEQALREAEQALDIALELRSHTYEAYWLLALGAAQRALGKHADALVSYQRCAVLHRRLGHRSREALAWYGTGETYQAMDRPADAAAFHRRAAAAHRDVGDRWNEALALEGLASALAGTEPAQAATHRAAAVRLIEGYEDPRAAGLRRALRAAEAGGA